MFNATWPPCEVALSDQMADMNIDQNGGVKLSATPERFSPVVSIPGGHCARQLWKA